MLIRLIWHARNALLWDGKLESPAIVSHAVNLHLQTYVNAQISPRLSDGPV